MSETISHAERVEGGLVGLLVGDALGVPYEFTPAQLVPPLTEIEFDPPPGFDFAAREVHLSEDLVDTGDISANGTDLLSLEFATVLGPVSLQGEWMSSWVDQTAGPDLYFTGAYAQVSWFATGGIV